MLENLAPNRHKLDLLSEALYALIDRSKSCKNIRGQIWRSIRNCQLGQIRDRWFIPVRRMKTKPMAWLLRWFMIAQSTLISYHTEAFVKTEVACTVKHILKLWSIHFNPEKVALNCFTILFKILLAYCVDLMKICWRSGNTGTTFFLLFLASSKLLLCLAIFNVRPTFCM